MPIIQKVNLRYVFGSLLLSFSMPVLAATFNWQGPYIGAYVGGGFGDYHTSSNAGSVTSSSYFTTPVDITAVNNAGTRSSNHNKVIGGVQLGHDWAWQHLVYGVAFDFGALPMSSSNTTISTYPDNSDTFLVYTSMRTNWLYTFRGRVGYQTMPCLPALFYFTGGMAVTKLRVSNYFNDNSTFAGTGSSYISQNQIGWTAGAGVEVYVYKHLSVDFQYLYVSVPSVKTVASISNTQGGFGIPTQSVTSILSTTGKFRANLINVGLNYRIDE